VRQALGRIAERVRVHYGPTGRDFPADFWETLPKGVPPSVGPKVAALVRKVEDQVGDGRKTAVLIATVTAETALAEVRSAEDAQGVAGAIRTAAEQAAELIDAMSAPARSADQVLRVAVTAALGDQQIGDALAEAFPRVGQDGIIRIDRLPPDLSTPAVQVHFEEGLRFPFAEPPGWVHDEFFHQPMILVSLSPARQADLLPLLEVCRRESSPLLFLCPEVEPEAADLARWSYRQHHLRLIPFAAAPHPEWRGLFADIAVATGARLIEPGAGEPAGEMSTQGLGTAERVVLDPKALVFYCGRGARSEVMRHIGELRQGIAREPADERKERLAERLAHLTGGVGVIEVCGATEVQVARRYDLACSALHASRWFIAYGGVPGSGAAYVACADTLSGLASPDGGAGEGLRCLAAGLEAPARCLAALAEMEGDAVLAELRRPGRACLDVARRVVEKKPNEGPLDATQVARTVVLTAGQAAANLVAGTVDRLPG
jgi:chaperonin GroEL